MKNPLRILAEKLSLVPSRPTAKAEGWFTIHETKPGDWQRNISININTALGAYPVYACITLIASDVAKVRLRLVENIGNDVWQEIESPAFSPVLRKPNKLQTRPQFWESWMLSKLIRGNTYVLKVRDGRGIVVGLWVLNPDRVQPLITPMGDPYYQLMADDVPGIQATVTVPGSEIIHDRYNTMGHPLVGISPLFACLLPASTILKMQESATKVAANNGQPGGILTADGEIDPDAAARLKKRWEETYGQGDNTGKVAVLGNGLKYEKLSFTAVEAEVIDNLKLSAEAVCSCFHVPPYKIGVGEMPTYNNIEALNVGYYSQCLQVHFEQIEACMDDGLGLNESKEGGKRLGTEFDVLNLLRMDSAASAEVVQKLINAGVLTPDEARARFNLEPKPGGDTPYLQEQNFSLAALAKRDAMPNPWLASKPAPAPAAAPTKQIEMDAQPDARSLQRRAMLAEMLGLGSIPLTKA